MASTFFFIKQSKIFRETQTYGINFKNIKQSVTFHFFFNLQDFLVRYPQRSAAAAGAGEFSFSHTPNYHVTISCDSVTGL
jgi:hypothetical protein